MAKAMAAAHISKMFAGLLKLCASENVDSSFIRTFSIGSESVSQAFSTYPFGESTTWQALRAGRLPMDSGRI